MRIIKVIILSILIYTSSYAKDEIKFGLLYGEMFLSEKEARIGANLWLQQMKEQYPDVQSRVVFYKNEKQLLKDFEDKKVSAIIINGYFYYSNKKFLDDQSIYRWILSASDKKFDEYYLIKNVNSSFSLKNKNRNNQKILYKDNLQRVWIESLFLKNGIKIKEIEQKFKRVVKTRSPVYEIFFNRANAAIVNKDVYDSMLKLNPQLIYKIKIVEKSDPIFFNAIGFTKSGIKQKHLDILMNVSERINNSVLDNGVLSYLQIQNVFLLGDSELKRLDTFYEEYNSLKMSNK